MRATTLSALTFTAAALLVLGACSSDLPTGADPGSLAAARGGNGGGKGGGGKPGPTPAPDRIAYSEKAADGSINIFVVNADGTGATAITSTGMDYSPRWTADHSRIVFVSDRDGIGHVYIMNADGSNPVRLTNTNYRDADPVPSPDGTHIVFQRNGAGVSGLYIMNMDGSALARLNTADDAIQPAWSPDGQSIAFVSYGGYAYQSIYMMSIYGTGLSLVDSCGSYPCLRPAFSPDGTRVAFWTSANNGEIDWIALDKQSFATIATNLGPMVLNAPAWSPDGTRIAFSKVSMVTGDEDLYSAASADGSNATQLTSATGLDAYPSWYR